MQTDVLVLGGLSGITAGLSCRRHYPDKKVVLVRKEGTVLIPCGIPYIYGTVGGPQNNVIPDGLLETNNIELVKGEAVSVDREHKLVTLKDGETILYDKLVFATGSLPLVPPIPGVDKKNIYAIKKDFNYLDSVLDEMKSVKDLVIVGGGFIGVEFADECRKGRDINVTVIEALSHCLQMALDDEFCAEAEAKLLETGVKIMTGVKVEAFVGDEAVSGVKLADGTVIKADMVILGIGATPNTELAQKAGLELGFRNAIKVDRYMQTYTDPNVFACGDCAEKQSFFTGRPTGVMLASIATSEARIAGANLYSTVHQNCGAISVFSTIVNGRAFAVAGLTERQARQYGMNIVIGKAEAPDTHPGGMPNSTLIKVKLVFAKETGVLIGGSISGGKSIGEMVNVLSACIMHRMTADDIVKFQMGTHPALTSSPIAYPIVNAACKAVLPIRQ
ncbi:pyridine nucleotide-disulfide oxidoreductase [Ornatilinea apprima]|uniref:Pyridine nucleotide-disulfide oxidoreductase n=1 Tax=Ornatilinea apprima TaxID=1134406 RepID=A0A0P6XKJ5_9CHLR|nr:pyridine nucleotide-disulfide oxidoreductase [Ornatilinea apprima]